MVRWKNCNVASSSSCKFLLFFCASKF
jgi:hypothetical protein